MNTHQTEHKDNIMIMLIKNILIMLNAGMNQLSMEIHLTKKMMIKFYYKNQTQIKSHIQMHNCNLVKARHLKRQMIQQLLDLVKRIVSN